MIALSSNNGNCEKLSLLETLKILGIDNKKEHFSEEEFLNLINMINYYNEEKVSSEYIRQQKKGYKVTIEKYKTVSEWDNADQRILYVMNKYSNLLYYQAMILTGGFDIRLDNVIKEYRKLPEVLSKRDYNSIVEAMNKLKYSETTQQRVLRIIRRILICKRINFYDLQYKDIEEYSSVVNTNTSRKGLASTVRLLREFNIINSQDIYYFSKKVKPERVIKLDINAAIQKVYEDFQNNYMQTCYKKTYVIRERCARKFLLWLNKYYPNITIVDNIEIVHVREYIDRLKSTTKKNGELRYSDNTINGYLSHLKSGFFQYIKQSKQINKELEAYIFGNYAEYYKMYYTREKRMHDPVSREDRINIENAIYSAYDTDNTIFNKMIILLYQLGLRPFELLTLKLDCIKGTKEMPQIYIHRCKKFKQRYIPLTEECLTIVQELRESNKSSQNIYSEIDGLSCKRLFNFNGAVPSIVTLEDKFSKILVKSGIIKSNGEAKYTLYILRSLRITLWLEHMDVEIVAKLAGHDEIDSHNSYIVSKEIRIENCKKVFDKYYSKLLSNDNYELLNDNSIDNNEEKNFIEELNNSLLEIENKTINKLAMESIISEFPEYSLPIPCGNCLAKFFDEKFECAMMDIPCIECENLKISETSLKIFDDFVIRIIKNRNMQKKKNVDGLVEQSNEKIERLKTFYITKLNFSDKEVEEKFNKFEKMYASKRGRKRKVEV